MGEEEMNKHVGIHFAVIVFVAALFCGDAAATLAPVLPESSHYDGSLFYDLPYDDGFLRGRIDFAVYDTELYPDEYVGAGGYPVPGDGRYVYAYQIFNDYEASDVAVAAFAILGIAEETIGAIGSEADPESGVEPTEEYLDAGEGVWQFRDALVYAGDHSYFLVLTSDNDWVEGTYRIEGPESDVLPAPDTIPEPSVIVLLGGGFLFAFATRRRR
jgi:hypothetical protein